MNNGLKFNPLYRSSFSPCFSISPSFPYLLLSFPPSCNKIVQTFSGFCSINTQRNSLLPLPDNCIFQFTIWLLQDYSGLPFPPSTSFLGSEWYLDTWTYIFKKFPEQFYCNLLPKVENHWPGQWFLIYLWRSGRQKRHPGSFFPLSMAAPFITVSVKGLCLQLKKPDSDIPTGPWRAIGGVELNGLH